MSASNSPSLTETFPTELLEQIFLLTSARDILRMSSVNHACHSLVQDSPSLQHEIDLFATGLRRNPRMEAVASLPDRRAALGVYRGRLEAFDAEKWDKVFDVDSVLETTAVSGTYGILGRDSVKFFTLGSVSRGIPRREWDVSFKDHEARFFTFCPQADILAVVEKGAWIIRLISMSDGEPHPAAQTAVLFYNFPSGGRSFADILDASITCSKLAVLKGTSDGDIAEGQVVVWDWTTGQILLELENQFYRSAKFVDDYWLAFLIASCEPGATPQLVLLNTEQATTDDAALAQTTFHFDPDAHLNLKIAYLHLDQGGHKPSREEGLLAPFYPDTSQRVLAVQFHDYHQSVFAMKTEILLRLAQGRGGTDVYWAQWGAHTVEILPETPDALWISGPRLFRAFGAELEDDRAWIDVYDFSAQGSARRLEERTNRDDVVQQITWPSVRRHQLPWDGSSIHFGNGGHDSVVFLTGIEWDQGLQVWSF